MPSLFSTRRRPAAARDLAAMADMLGLDPHHVANDALDAGSYRPRWGRRAPHQESPSELNEATEAAFLHRAVRQTQRRVRGASRASRATLMMQERTVNLAAVDDDAATQPLQHTGHLDTRLKSLFLLQSRKREDNPRAPPGGFDGDSLHSTIYHALLSCFLSGQAEHTPPEGAASSSRAPPTSHVDRCSRLEDVVKSYTADKVPSVPAQYKIHALCYAKWAPTTLIQPGNLLYVACRGSDSPADWWKDFQVLLMPIPTSNNVLPRPAQVHTGFHKVFASQVEDVLSKIDNVVAAGAEGGPTEVVFCGHSLGGAVAQLLALAFAYRKRQTGRDPTYFSQIVTFGSPRIGDWPLGLHFEDYTHHRRLFVRNDPIPCVPGAVTARRMLHLDPMYDYLYATESWELLQKCQAKPCTLNSPDSNEQFKHGRFLKTWRNHFLSSYVSALVDHYHISLTIYNSNLRPMTASSSLDAARP